MKVTKLFLIAAGVIGLAGYSGLANAVHTGGNVPLLKADGTAIVPADTVGYSPKATCGGCHNYESDWDTATKMQVDRAGNEKAYDVPYPQHGVTAAYHIQQGRNISWNNTQRSYYGLPNFTSSAGMYGKY